ncbi:MAG: autotransporter-associated beta strand repeat-containing protein [Planctomycetia bacterium]|nr:autotransporter-associated beta strand repeat-containing protein [Planctomycetia bacterium]
MSVSFVAQSWGAVIELPGVLAAAATGSMETDTGAASGETYSSSVVSNPFLNLFTPRTVGGTVLMAEGDYNLDTVVTLSSSTGPWETGQTIAVQDGGGFAGSGSGGTVNNAIRVDGSGTVDTTNAQLTWNGAVTGEGTITLVGNSDYNNFWVNGNTTAFAGTFVVGTGSNYAKLVFQGSNNATGSATADFSSTDNGAIIFMRPGTYDLGSLNGSGSLRATSGDTNFSTTKEITLRIGANGDSVYSGAITNGAGIIGIEKVGTGTTLTLSNNSSTTPSTYTGGVKVSEGTVKVTSAAALGTGTVTLNGGTFDIASGGTITNAITVVELAAGGSTLQNNAGEVALTGKFSGSGNATVTGSGNIYLQGDMSEYSGTLTSASKICFRSAGSGSTATGVGSDLMTVHVNDGANLIFMNGDNDYHIGALTGGGDMRPTTTTFSTLTTINVIVGGANTDCQYNGLISDKNYNSTAQIAITKIGNGELALHCANTFSGGVTLKEGTLRISWGAGLGTGTLTLAGGTIRNNTDNLERTVSNAINSLEGTRTEISAANGQGRLIFTGTLTGSGTIAKTGSGGNHAYFTGDMSEFEGTFSAEHTGGWIAFGRTSGVTEVQGSTKASFVTTKDNCGFILYKTKDAQFNMGNLTGTTGIVRPGEDTSVPVFTLHVGGRNEDGDYGGILTNSNNNTTKLAVVKDGTGTWTLSRDGNTFSGGLTVNNGAVLLANGSGIYSDVTMNGGALGVAGTEIGAVTINGNVRLNNGRLRVRLDGGDSDLITVTGNLIVNLAEMDTDDLMDLLEVEWNSDNLDFESHEVLEIMGDIVDENNEAIENFAQLLTDASNGLFLATEEDGMVSLALNPAAVPEPGAWVLMILGAGALGLVQRRRMKALKR